MSRDYFDHFISDHCKTEAPQELLTRFQAQISSYRKPMTQAQLEVLEKVLMFELDPASFPEVVLWNAPAGAGKSTFLKVKTAYFGNEMIGQVGGLILMRKRSEVRAFCEVVNSLGWNDKVSYPLLPPRDGEGDTKPIAVQLQESKEYPFVCMTWEKFKSLLNNGELDFLKTYYLNGQKLTRSLIICDEAPILVGIDSFTRRDLSTIEDTIDFLKSKGVISSNSADTMESACSVVKSLFARDRAHVVLPALSPSFEIPKDVKESWRMKSGSMEVFKRLMLFERAVTQKTNLKIDEYGNVILYVSEPVSLPVNEFKILVLDASSTIDPNVPSNWVKLEFPFEGDEYSNTRIWFYQEISASASQYKEHSATIFRDVAVRIKAVFLKRRESYPHKEIVIIIHKDYVEPLKAEVEKLFEGVDGVDIMYKHLDGGRGTNAYQSCTLLFLVGRLSATETVYPLLTAHQRAIESAQKVPNPKGGHLFVDEWVQDLYQRAVATSEYQEISRERPYKSDTLKEIVYLGTNADIFNLAVGEMKANGAKVYTESNLSLYRHKNKPKSSFTKTQKAILAYVKDNMVVGSKMTKSQLAKEIDCSTNSIGNALKSKEFLKECYKLGVTFTYQQVLKNEAPQVVEVIEPVKEEKPAETVLVDPNPLTKEELEAIEF